MPDVLQYPDTINLTGAVEIQAGAAGDKIPKVQILAYGGDELDLAGWSSPVVVDLAGMTHASTIPILADHDEAEPVGHGQAEIRKNQLFVQGALSVPGPKTDRIKNAAANGFQWQSSIGAKPISVKYIQPDEKFAANGKTFKAGARGNYVIEKSRLREVSILSLAADEKTTVKISAKQGVTTMPEPITTNTAENVNDFRGAEAARVEAIARICGTDHPAIMARAIKDGLTADQCELAILRAEKDKRKLNELHAGMPTGPFLYHRPTEGQNSADIIAAAVLQATGTSDKVLQATFKEPVLDQAHARFRGRIGLQQIILEAAAANGYQGPSNACKTDLGNVLRAAYSTLSLSTTLSNIGNKFVVQGFSAVESVWRLIAQIRSGPDFKQMTGCRLVADAVFQQVGPGGELQHGTASEETYTNQLHTYGRIYQISRPQIINDDLGVLQDMQSVLGVGAAEALNQVFWTAFLNNASFFTSARGNFDDGAGSALSFAGLEAAELLFLDQLKPNGAPLGISPATLLVPTALKAAATQLTTSEHLLAVLESVGTMPDANPFQNRFKAVASAYLGNANFAGYSPKAWYLLADPNALPVIEIAFLNGQQVPTIETADADFSTLGIQFRGYWDFGVALKDYRGGVKMKGEQ